MRARTTIFAAAMVFAVPAPAALAQSKITVQHRWEGDILAGYALEYDLVVDSRGQVSFRNRPFGDRDAWQTIRFHISGQEFAAFRDAFATIRPVGEAGPDDSCHDENHQAGGIDWDIRWSGDGPDGHLLSCWGNRAVLKAQMLGLRVLRISIWTRHRMSPAKAKAYDWRFG